MVGMTRNEMVAVQAGVAKMAEVIAEIGFEVPPSAWTHEQVTAIAQAAIGGFMDDINRLKLDDEVPF